MAIAIAGREIFWDNKKRGGQLRRTDDFFLKHQGKASMHVTSSTGRLGIHIAEKSNVMSSFYTLSLFPLKSE